MYNIISYAKKSNIENQFMLKYTIHDNIFINFVFSNSNGANVQKRFKLPNSIFIIIYTHVIQK